MRRDAVRLRSPGSLIVAAACACVVACGQRVQPVAPAEDPKNVGRAKAPDAEAMRLYLACPSAEEDCTVTLTNEGAKPVFLDKQLRAGTPETADQDTLHLRVTDENAVEQKLTAYVQSAPAVPWNFQYMAPGESLRASWPGVKGMYSLTKGKYRVRATYRVTEVFPEHAEKEIFKGPLESNEVVVEVH
jgi:hypothetical protein